MKKIYIAPIAGVTDFSYRKILREFNPDLVYTEMVSANAVTQANKKTVEKMLRLMPGDAVQIFGRDLDLMVKTAKFVEELGVNNIDVNMGCPMPKITKNGYGSALLEDYNHVEKLMSEIKSTLNDATNLSMKIRVGYKEHKDPVKFAKLAEKLKLSHITVHGRTREQMYSGEANWDIIKQVKDAVSIPVIGNGDIFDAEFAVDKINYSNVDGVMLARGIFGNPWLIAQIRELLQYGEIKTVVTDNDKIDIAIKHINNVREDWPEREFYYEVRKHLCWYLKGIKHSTKIKNLVNKVEDYDRLIDIFEQLRVVVNSN